MRKIWMLLVVAALVGCDSPSIRLGQQEHAFPEPVTAISAGRDRIWLGSETGSVFAFDPAEARFTRSAWVTYGRVYALCELDDSLMLVGIRNAGLRLVRLRPSGVETLKIYHTEKQTSYSPYGFVVKAGADGADTIFCSTSNGLFYAPFPRQNRAAKQTVALCPIYPDGQDPAYKFYSIAQHRGQIYAAGNKGLVRIVNPLAQNASMRVEWLRTGGTINCLCSDARTLYALDDSGKVFDCLDPQAGAVAHAGNAPLVYFRDSSLSLALSNTHVEISDLKTRAMSYRFDAPLAVGAENSRGRAVVVGHGDFLYLAARNSLLQVPRHLNLQLPKTIVAACRDGVSGALYAVSNRNDLYRLDPNGTSARFVRNIRLDADARITRLLGVTDGELYFSTRKKIYRIKPRFWAKPRLVAKGIRAEEPEIYGCKLDEQQAAVVVSYSDSIFCHYFDGAKTTSITPKGDFYTTSIARVSDDGGLLVGTLSEGIYGADSLGVVLRPLVGDITIDNVLDIAAVDASEAFVLAPSVIYKLRFCADGFDCVDSVAVSQNIVRIIYSADHLFSVSLAGGIGCYDATALQPVDQLFADVVFNKEGAFAAGDSLVLASELGLATLRMADGSPRLKWLQIADPSWFGRVFRWRFPLGIFGLLAGLGLLGLGVWLPYKVFRRGYLLTRVIAQRKDDLKRFDTEIVRMLSLIDDPTLRGELDAMISDHRLKNDQFLLSGEFWDVKAMLTTRISEVRRHLETEFRSVHKHHMEELTRATFQTCAKELFDQSVTVFGSKQFALADLHAINDKVCRWLDLYGRFGCIKERVGVLAARRLAPDLQAEVAALSAFIHEFDVLSYAQWTARFEELEAKYALLDDMCRGYSQQLSDQIVRAIDALDSDIEPIRAFRRLVIRSGERGDGVAMMMGLCRLEAQISPLEALVRIGHIVEQTNALPASVRQNSRFGTLRPGADFDCVAALQRDFEQTLQQFYDTLSSEEQTALKSIGLVKKMSSFRKLLVLLLLLDYSESGKTSLYILMRADNIDAHEVVDTRKNELKRDKLKPNAEKMEDDLSLVGLVVRIVDGRLK